MARRDRDVNVGNVEGWRSEPSGIIDGGSAGGIEAIAPGSTVLLRDDKEPSNGKRGSICGIDQRVADVERCQSKAVEGGLRPNVRGKQRG